jgi:hypothetical protein
MMSQLVQQGGGQLRISEDLHPFAEGEIGGDQCRPPFIPLRYQVEEQFSAGAVERHESQFINLCREQRGRLETDILVVYSFSDGFVSSIG